MTQKSLDMYHLPRYTWDMRKNLDRLEVVAWCSGDLSPNGGKSCDLLFSYYSNLPCVINWGSYVFG